MLDRLKKDIELKLNSADSFEGLQLPPFDFGPAPAHANADASSPWAMTCAKTLKKNPLEIAKTAAKIIKEVSGVEDAFAAAPGFINIKFSDSFICEAAADRRLKNRATSGENRERVLIEFVSANPTGPLHVASGRGASLGDSLVRIFNAVGIPCDAEFYVNDYGNQAELLGRSLKARVLGQEPPENGYHGDYLVEMAAKIKDTAANWTDKEFSVYAIETMLALHKQDMANFNVEFNRWFRESELYADDMPAKTLEFLKAQGQAYEDGGAMWFGSSKDGSDDKDRVLVRADGRPTYFLADIAYHKNKYDRAYTKLIDIWGADHHGYVPRMKAAVKALGKSEDSFVPIIHQLVHLIEGGEKVKMSKRSGRFITLKELTEEVGADVCRFFFASRTANAHMNFDIDLAKKRTNENPVFYVQYVHARISSIARAAEEKGFVYAEQMGGPLLGAERALAAKLLWFKSVVHTCAKDLSPHHLTAYLIELASLFHSFYDTCKVLDENNKEVSASRLLLCRRVAERIKKGLEFIGVSAPEAM